MKQYNYINIHFVVKFIQLINGYHILSYKNLNVIKFLLCYVIALVEMNSFTSFKLETTHR